MRKLSPPTAPANKKLNESWLQKIVAEKLVTEKLVTEKLA